DPLSPSVSPQKLEGSKSRGQLLIFGATNWDLIGRKEVPKQQAAYRNLGQNLWGPHRYGGLAGLRVRSVVSGPCAAHSLLISAEGRLWSWGRNEKGQLGHGDTKRVEAPKLIEVLASEAIVAAACGRNHTLALTGMARPERGPNPAPRGHRGGERPQNGGERPQNGGERPQNIMYNGQPITKLGCGAEFSMVLDCKGNLYSFGCPEYGQLGHNSDGKFIARAQRIEYDCELVPRRVGIFVERTKDGQVLPVPNVVVRDVACGANHTLVLDSQKRVFSWGFGGYGRLGHAEQKDELVPRLVKLFDFPGRGASQIYAGYTCSFAVSETGGDIPGIPGILGFGVGNAGNGSFAVSETGGDIPGILGFGVGNAGNGSFAVSETGGDIPGIPGILGFGVGNAGNGSFACPLPADRVPLQVAMGYAHSLVIARDESEAEQEKLRKLPEYNPRTL
ncbi:RCC2 protein, partial [Corvus moneduloides]|nr:RCC2 protein [Corvus moneduloides]